MYGTINNRNTLLKTILEREKMNFGINREGKKVFIENSVEGEAYRCPLCGKPLIRKIGQIKAPHFAHKNKCCDPWSHDNKGPWHKKMQSQYLPEQCEVRIDGENGEFHSADVVIEEEWRNIIIEFQHSPITQKEFDERNRFYSTYGRKQAPDGKYYPNKVVWLFDFRDKRMFIDTDVIKIGMDDRMEKACENEMCISAVPGNCRFSDQDRTQAYRPVNQSKYARIIWKRPSKMFKNVPPNVHIYFDVRQRRYVTGTHEWKGHESEWYNFLSEIYAERHPFYKKFLKRKNAKKDDLYGLFKDSLDEFLVFASYDSLDEEEMEMNSNLINYDLKNHPDRIIGVPLTHSEFFEKYKEKEYAKQHNIIKED